MNTATIARFTIPILLSLGLAQSAYGQKKETRTLFPIDHQTALIDISGKTVLSSSHPELVKEIESVSRTLGGFRRARAETWIRFGEFSEGLAEVGWALCPMCRNPMLVQGVIDQTGRMVIRPQNSFTRYGNFREGLARYSDRGWGFIDREGHVVIEARFYEVSDFSEGRAFVRVTEKSGFGYIDKKGELIIAARFMWADDFHDGFAAIKSATGAYGFIDKTGTMVPHSPEWFDVKEFSEGLAGVQVEVADNSVYRGYRDRKYGFVDRTGRFVIAPRFNKVQSFSEGRALFWQTGQQYGCGFIDASGEVLIKPEYLDGKSFSEGLAAMAIKSSDEKKLWGFIDREGAWVIQPQFTSAESFNGGLAAVNCDEYRDCKGYIDTAGNYRWQKQ